MSTQAPPFPKYSPGVMSMLPLFYVGWADEVLSPSEVKLIQKQMKQFAFLSKEDVALLKTWSDPAKPPSSELFKHWVHLIKDTNKDLPMDKRRSLADLGIEMAKRSAGSTDELVWNSVDTKNALIELEDALEVNELSDYRNIFTAEQIQQNEQLKKAPSFDVKAMQDLLDGPSAPLKNKIKTLLIDPAFKLETITDKEKYRDRVMEWCKLLADQGIGSLSYPEACGGKDDMRAYAVTFETLGYHDLSLTIKFGVQFGLFGGSVLWLGTDYHHEKFLTEIGTLEIPGCFAMTETGHGSNVRGLETTATYDSKTDEIIVHTPHKGAGKEYIGNAIHGHMASVFAQLIVDGENHGVHAMLVPLRGADGKHLPGIKVEDCGYKLGLNGVDNGRIWFDQVRIPRQNLLNRFGNIDENGKYTSPIENPSKRFFTMLGTLVGGRVCVPMAGLSATKTSLNIAIRYATQRRQFGPNDNEPETLLLDYPSHQKRLMPMLAKTYALHFAQEFMLNRYVNRSEDDIREIETLAAGLKSYATWFTTAAIQECREACGGKGYLAENRFAELKADTDIFTTFEGDNTVLMQLVSKGLLSAFKAEFHNEGFMGVIRFLAGQFSTSVAELNPISIRKTDAAHLMDAQFQLSAFKYRERKLQVSVGQRMRDMIKMRINSYDAFLRSQNQMLELSHAYVERIVLEKFIEKVEATENPALKKVLKKLCDVYALSTIQDNKGWYLENDYMTGAKTIAINRLVEKFNKDLRSDAKFLVDAFGIPEVLVNADIVG